MNAFRNKLSTSFKGRKDNDQGGDQQQGGGSSTNNSGGGHTSRPQAIHSTSTNSNMSTTSSTNTSQQSSSALRGSSSKMREVKNDGGGSNMEVERSSSGSVRFETGKKSGMFVFFVFIHFLGVRFDTVFYCNRIKTNQNDCVFSYFNATPFVN